MRKLLFLVHPNAGQRRVNKSLTDIIGIFNEGGYEVTVFLTNGSTLVDVAVLTDGGTGIDTDTEGVTNIQTLADLGRRPHFNVQHVTKCSEEEMIPSLD